MKKDNEFQGSSFRFHVGGWVAGVVRGVRLWGTGVGGALEVSEHAGIVYDWPSQPKRFAVMLALPL